MEKNILDNEISKEFANVFKFSKKPKILLCTPEITELPEGMGNAANIIANKGGGLGDISASLVKNLSENKEYELHIVLPKYDSKIKHLAAINTRQIDQLAVILSGRGIHLVNDSAFSYINSPYEENKIHTPIRRSLVFQRHIINNLLDFIQPDVVHCNDWMTGIIPAAAKSKGIKCLFTLHNIFTEKQTLKEIELSGIRPMDFAEHLYFEKFPGNIHETWKDHFDTNKVDFTASAILASDYFNTVSETFLDELVSNYFDDLVPKSIYATIKDKYDLGRAVGILNAPNDNVNPKLLRNIINFNKHNVEEKKAENKRLFQEKIGLPQEADIPLFFWPNRLYPQKGPDLIINYLEEFIRKYQMQIAFVANGDDKFEKELKKLSSNYPQIAYMSFREDLSSLGKAGADFILMPSRYEPCGLPQMEAPRFGTLPIVRATGGLKDTVTPLNIDNHTGNGFVFLIADKMGIEYGIQQALNFYAQPKEVRYSEIKRIMSESKRQFNMKKTASKYMAVYDKLIIEKKGYKPDL